MIEAFFFVAFSTILTIVNPVGALGPFLAMTVDDGIDRRRKVARRASLVTGCVLAFCAAAGAFVFNFYGITLPALKIAGGVLLFYVSFDMLNARPPRSKGTEEEQNEGVQKDDIAVFPLAIPLLSGPGAVVSVFMLADQAKSTLAQVSLYGAIALTTLIVFLMLREAHRVVAILGQIGINVMSRLMGLVLASMSMQFIIDGIRAALPGLVGAP